MVLAALRFAILLLASVALMFSQAVPARVFSAATVPVSVAAPAPAGIAVDSAGKVYVAQPDARRVIRLSWNGETYEMDALVAGSSNMSALFRPVGVAVDISGNVYIADAGAEIVTEVPWNGTAYGTPVTAYGTPVIVLSGVSGNAGLTVDGTSNLYVADEGHSRIVRVPSANGIWGAPAEIGSGWNHPAAVAVDAVGNLFIADSGNNRVVELMKEGYSFGAPATVAAGLAEPRGLAFDAEGALYISNLGGDTLTMARRGAGFELPTPLAFSKGGTWGIAVGSRGEVFLARNREGAITVSGLIRNGLPKADAANYPTGQMTGTQATLQPRASNCGVTAGGIPYCGQTISFSQFFGSPAPGTTVNLTATATSGLPVSYTSNTNAVCTVSGSTVTLRAIGTCSITANQAGSTSNFSANPYYFAADPVTQTFTTAAKGIYIANGDVAGLIAAIQSLNSSGGGFIQLAANGTYSVSAASDWWYGPNAFPAISSTIYIDGNGSTISRASGSPKFRFFYVSGGFSTLPAGTLILKHLTLSGGLALGGTGGGGWHGGGGGGGLGGAIFNQGSVGLIDTTLTQNRAQGGNGGDGTDLGNYRGSGGGGGLGGDGEWGNSPGGKGGGFKGFGFTGNEAGGATGTYSGGTSDWGGNGGNGAAAGYGSAGGGGFLPGQNGGSTTFNCTDTRSAGNQVSAYCYGAPGATGGGTGGGSNAVSNFGFINSGGGAFGGGGGGTTWAGGGGGVGGGGGGAGFRTDDVLSGGNGGFGGGGGGGSNYSYSFAPPPGGLPGFAGGLGGRDTTFNYSIGPAGSGGNGIGGAIFNHIGSASLVRTTTDGNTVAGGAGGAYRYDQTYRSPNGSSSAAALYNLNGAVTVQDLALSSDFMLDANSAGIISPGQTPAATILENNVTAAASIATSGSVSVLSSALPELAPVTWTAQLYASVGSSATAPVSIANLGNAVLNFSVLVASGDFQVQNCSSLPAYSASQPGLSTCTPTVTFSPTAPGVRNGVLIVAGNFPGSPQAVFLSAVGLTPQTITFNPPATVPFGSTTIGLTATASSGLPVSLASTTQTVCTVSGANLTTVSAGTCQITATQAGNSVYEAAPPVTATFQIVQGPQTITFNPATTVIPVSQGSFTVSATASSGLAVAFNIQQADGSCSVSGTTVTIGIKFGVLCIVQATRAGNSNYLAATPVNVTYSVVWDQQLVMGLSPSFASIPNVTIGSAPFAVRADSHFIPAQGSGQTGQRPAIASTTPSVCSVGNATYPYTGVVVDVTPVAPGTCTLRATAAATDYFYAATPLDVSFTVLRAQTITFGSLPDRAYGSATFTVSATASSSLTPVTFSSATTGVCTVSGTTVVTLVAAGTCTLQGTQAGNSVYGPVTASQSFQVTPGSQTITFGALSNQVFGTAPLTVAATASSGLPVSFTSLTAAVCTVTASGTTVTLIAGGQCTIQASQAGNSNWSAANPVPQSFTVTPAVQTISFARVGNQAAGTSFTLGATASSGLDVTYSSSPTSVCTVSGSVVSAVAAGLCTLQGSQAGNASYSAATPVSQNLNVVQIPTSPVVGNLSAPGGTWVSGAGSSSVLLPVNGAWTATSNSSFLHIAAGSASGTGPANVVFNYDAFTGTGTRTGTLTVDGATITVTQVGTDYRPAPPPSTSLLLTGGAWMPAVDSSGNVYFTNLTNSGSGPGVYQFNAATHQSSILPGTSTSNKPYGIAVDLAGNLYYTLNDAGNLMKWTASTQQVSTLASGLNSPTGVAVDATGNVYIAEGTLGGTLKLWNAASQQVTTVLSSGLSWPEQLAVDLAGNVYIANALDGSIGRYSPVSGQMTTLITNQDNPVGVAVDGSGNVYIANYFGSAGIVKWNASTQQTTTLLAPQPLPNSTNYNPTGVAASLNGDLYFSEFGNGVQFNILGALPNAFLPSALSLPAGGGSGAVNVLPATENPNLGTQTISSPVPWLTIGTISSGTVNLSYTANTTGATRTTSLVILDQVVNISQSSLSSQSIFFASPPNEVIGTGPYTLSASASSGLTVSFASTTQSVCTVFDTTVTLVTTGTCTIQATQSGNASYAAATPVSQSFQVTLPTQTVTFGALSNQTAAATPFSLSATASSGLAVTFSSLTPGVCTVSGSTVTLVAAGTCKILATQAGSSSYAPARATQAFLVTPVGVAQTITFGTLTNRVLGSVVTLSATVSSGLPVAFSSNTPLICQVGGAKVTTIASGTCTIEAVQRGSASYLAAAPVRRSFTVSSVPSGVLTAAAASPFATGGAPSTAAIADFNADGIADIATANQSGSITVLLGSASGGFTVAPAISLTGSPFAVAAGDFNADGYPDLVVSNQAGGTVTVLLGDGTGGFSAAPGSAYALGQTGRSFAVADFNGDGNLDVVVGTNSSTVALLLGDGAGGFTAAAGSPFAVGNGAWTVVTADLNGDGNPDIAAGNLNGASVSVLLGDGAGGFTSASGSPYSVGASPQGLTIGDFNGDAVPDIASANTGANTVSVLLGNGSGGFSASAASPVTVGASPRSIAVGDFNGDGIADLVTANQGGANVTVLQGDGAGGFTQTSGSPFTTGATPVFVVVADFNGDGRLDLASVNQSGNSVTLLLGSTAGQSQTITFGSLSNKALGAAPFTISATASSSLPVSFASASPAICTVSGSTVTVLALGTCSLQATQAGNATFGAATPVTRTFSVLAPATPVTSQFTVSRGAVTFNRTTGIYSQLVTLANNGTAVSAAAYVLDSLAAGYTLLNPAGVTSATTPPGSPFVEVGPIGAAASVTFTIQFTRVGTPALTYTPRVLGPGVR